MKEIEFTSHDVICRGWHCPPRSEELRNERGAPALVMAHGTSGVREQLKQYIHRFTSVGIHVLLFDYRHFGTSDGYPRQLLSIHRQLQDYGAALDFVRAVPGVDPERVGLWGTSLSGGHVVKAAVKDGRVAAVVAQAAAMDNLATVRHVVEYAGFEQVLKLTWLGFVDVGRSVLALSPQLVPVGGAPGEVALMTTPDALAGLKRTAVTLWRNEICARLSLTLPFYRPGLLTGKLKCPILIAICDDDSVTAPAAAEAAARRAGDLATVRHYPIGHFDIYHGDGFDRSVGDQVTFLQEAFALEKLPFVLSKSEVPVAGNESETRRPFTAKGLNDTSNYGTRRLTTGYAAARREN